jgi:hypothetical protein
MKRHPYYREFRAHLRLNRAAEALLSAELRPVKGRLASIDPAATAALDCTLHVLPRN